MKHIIAIFLVFISCLSINAEVRIHMEHEGGVYKVPCEVNGLKLKFIFDTGAASVCISQTYAEMMLENGYLHDSDILGSSQSTLADGRTVDNVVINLRNVEIGGLTLNDVSAVVVPTQNAPLLLGQSVIQRLGKVSIEGQYLVIHNANNYTEEELDAIFEKAEKLLDNNKNLQALESYRIIYEAYGDETNPWVLFNMGICYARLDDRNSSIKCYLKAIELADGEDDENDVKFEAYYKLAVAYYFLNDADKSINYYIAAAEYTETPALKAECYIPIADYYTLESYFKAIEYYQKAEKIYDSSHDIDFLTKARLYDKITTCYLINERYSKGIEYCDKTINSYNSAMKNNRLDENDLFRYIDSYQAKGAALLKLSKYDDAIDAFNTVKEKLKQYDNQFTEKWRFDALNNAVNRMLSSCYEELTKN